MDNQIKNSSAYAARDKIIYPHIDPAGQTDILVVAKGDGIRVSDDAGTSYIEGVAGLWCASLGFSNERLAEAAYKQMRELPYYLGSAYKSHPRLIELAEKLLELAPVNMGKVFFANSGSEANDTAIKAIWYYNNARGMPQKKKIIGRRNGYHGVTLATASLTGFDYNHRGFDGPLDRFLHVMAPNFYRNGLPGETEENFATRCANELEELILSEGPDTVAAMFMEPVMGSGGIIVPPRTYAAKMQAVLRKYDVLLVTDEVVCAFGRIGEYWGHSAVGLKPDIISTAKALSSGYIPISALLISKSVADVIMDQAHIYGGFAHNFTYTGHPVAAAVALEALKIYDEMDVAAHVKEVGGYLQSELRRRFADHPLIGDVRGMGLLAGIEIVSNKEARASFAPELKVGNRYCELCQDAGLILRGLSSDTVAICPPLTVTKADIDAILDIMLAVLDALGDELQS